MSMKSLRPLSAFRAQAALMEKSAGYRAEQRELADASAYDSSVRTGTVAVCAASDPEPLKRGTDDGTGRFALAYITTARPNTQLSAITAVLTSLDFFLPTVPQFEQASAEPVNAVPHSEQKGIFYPSRRRRAARCRVAVMQ